jgi:hypothetical protein
MHGGTSRRGCDHPNCKTGEYSKVSRKAKQTLGRLLNRPIEVRVILYPETLEEQAGRVRRGQRLDGHLIYPNEYGQLPLPLQLRALRAAKKEINAKLREVNEAVRCMQSEGTGPA